MGGSVGSVHGEEEEVAKWLSTQNLRVEKQGIWWDSKARMDRNKHTAPKDAYQGA
jgi:hypothetical protein